MEKKVTMTTPPQSNDTSEQIPSKVGKYKIESLLDKGGMSVLYLGLNPETKEPLAIKTLSSKLVSRQDMVERFMHEAQIIEITNHPNIVKLVGHGEWEGGLYIAMEFVQGLSLRQMILQQAMSLKRALEIVVQIGHALTHLHVHGIIHRDLKPENVLLTAQGGVKIVDFGISQLYTDKSQEEIKRLVGTPAYMSPEQRQDLRNVSFSTDIYSLGVITYELILGRLSHGTIHIAMAPKGLQRVLAKALQPDPVNRYEDIVDFVKDITTYMHSDALKQDMRGSDFAGELNEDLKEAQSLLIPSELPKWHRIEMGIASNCNMALSAVYYDFFQQKEGIYNIAMGESFCTGVEGLLQIAMLRGMVHALCHGTQDPRAFVALLNSRLMEGKNHPKFSFSFLTLFPHENRLAYISCGYTSLWMVPAGSQTPRPLSADNPALGTNRNLDVMEVEANWGVGDTCVLHTFQGGAKKNSEDTAFDENQFVAALQENHLLPPKKQAEAIFRRISGQKGRSLLERLITVISIART
ncbi:MAG: protein kinase domain-containing protein [Chlamydiales bacterium]